MSETVSLACPNEDGSVDFVTDIGSTSNINFAEIQNDFANLMQKFNLQLKSMEALCNFNDDCIEVEFKVIASRKI